MNILTIIRLAKQIQPPPDLEDETLFRAWFDRVAGTALEIAEYVDDDKADHAATMMQAIAKDDDLWERAYRILLDADKYLSVHDKRLTVAVACRDAELAMTTTSAVLQDVMETIDALRHER